MLYLLLIATTLLQSGKSVLFKKIGIDYQSSKQFFGVNGLSFGVASLIALIISLFSKGGPSAPSPYSVIMAVFFALAVIGMNLTQMKALSLGTTPSTMMIFSCGFLIPVIFSAIVYPNEEKILAVDIVALLLMLVALFLIINPENKEKLSIKWLLFTLVAMTFSGTLAILQKVHQHSAHANEFIGLSVCEFFFAGVILVVLSLISPKSPQHRPLRKREIGFGIINGFFMCVPSMINLFLAGKFPAIVMFPIYNIGSIILSSVLGGIIYREKVSKKSIVGFAVGCIAILLIGIF